MARINEMVLSGLQVALITEKITDGEFSGLAKSLDAKGDESIVVCDPAAVSAYEMQAKKDLFGVVESTKKQLSKTSLKVFATAQQLTDKFVEKSVKAGVDCFRVVDNDNDIQTLAKAVTSITKAGKDCEGAIYYQGKDTNEYVEAAKKLKGLGCKSFCVIDGGALLSPKKAIDLIKAVKGETGSPCGISITGNHHLAGAVYYALSDYADSFDSSLMEKNEVYFSSRVMSTIIAESESKDKLEAKSVEAALKQLEDILGKNISGISTALKPARAYDIAVEGQKYHVEIHPSKIGAVIKQAAQAGKPAAGKPAVTRPAPSGSSATPARPAPSSAAGSSAKAAPKAAPKVAPKTTPQQSPPATGGSKEVKSSMQGTIVKLLVKEGDAVERGQRIAVLEAMKMENDILATTGGTVKTIHINSGDAVQTGQTLITIE